MVSRAACWLCRAPSLAVFSATLARRSTTLQQFAEYCRKHTPHTAEHEAQAPPHSAP